MRPSIGELLIILLIVALLFGTRKLRNIGGDLGSAIKSFRDAMKSEDGHEAGGKDDTPPKGTVIEGKADSTSESSSKDR